MTIDQFTYIIETYGCEPANWPSDNREACKNLLRENIEARTLLARQEELDGLMNKLEVPAFPGLENKVLNQSLPPQAMSPADRFIDWLLPTENLRTQFWRPALAACLPLAFGIVIANFYSFGIGLEYDNPDYWADELTLLSLSDYSEVQY